VTSGLRVGTPAVTTRGMLESDMDQLVGWMDEVMCNAENPEVISKVGDAVKARMSQLPLFAEAVSA